MRRARSGDCASRPEPNVAHDKYLPGSDDQSALLLFQCGNLRVVVSADCAWAWSRRQPQQEQYSQRTIELIIIIPLDLWWLFRRLFVSWRYRPLFAACWFQTRPRRGSDSKNIRVQTVKRGVISRTGRQFMAWSQNRQDSAVMSAAENVCGDKLRLCKRLSRYRRRSFHRKHDASASAGKFC